MARGSERFLLGFRSRSLLVYSSAGGMLAGVVHNAPEIRVYETAGYKSTKIIRLPAPTEQPIAADFLSCLAFSHPVKSSRREGSDLTALCVYGIL